MESNTSNRKQEPHKDINLRGTRGASWLIRIALALAIILFYFRIDLVCGGSDIFAFRIIPASIDSAILIPVLGFLINLALSFLLLGLILSSVVNRQAFLDRIRSIAVKPKHKSQAELLHEAQLNKKRWFQIYSYISWGVLLASLVLIFSGNVLNVGVKVDANFISENMGFVACGVTTTIKISLLSILFATVLALLAALGRLSKLPPIYALSTFYVSLIRGTPLFLQIFFFFLALPQLGIILPGFWAGVIALGLNYGAYMSEIFRAGLSSVGQGQREAALAIGMTPRQMMGRVVIPQALRFAIPPTGNEFIAMLKDSALVSATGFVHELLWRAQKVGRAQFHMFEALIMAAIFYWVMTLIFSYFQGRLETQMAKGDRQHV